MGKDGVAVGNFGTLNAYQDDPGRFITGLLPGRLNKDYPIGEVPCKANTYQISLCQRPVSCSELQNSGLDLFDGEYVEQNGRFCAMNFWRHFAAVWTL